MQCSFSGSFGVRSLKQTSTVGPQVCSSGQNILHTTQTFGGSATSTGWIGSMLAAGTGPQILYCGLSTSVHALSHGCGTSLHRDDRGRKVMIDNYRNSSTLGGLSTHTHSLQNPAREQCLKAADCARPSARFIKDRYRLQATGCQRLQREGPG